MKKKTTVILLSLTLALSAHAAVQAMLFHISTNESFAVPAGKVLIVENMQYGTNWDQSAQLLIQNGTGSFTIKSQDFCPGLACSGPYDQYTLAFPLKFPEGWTINGMRTGFPANKSTDLWIFALLVDASDLYASLPNRIDSISLQGSKVTLGVQTASARPAQISVEKSADPAKGWRPARDAVVSRTTNSTQYAVTLPAEGSKEFFRSKAVPLAK